MGWMDKFKGIFQAKKEVQEKRAGIDEIEMWISDLRNIKLGAVNRELKNYRARILTKQQEIHDAIERLEKAELPNPNIPSRAKNLLDGNKNSYVRITRKLAEGIKPPEKYEDLEYFIAKFDNDLSELTKSTQRAYFILQEFLAIESREIALAIKGMETIVNDLREFIRREGFETIGHIEDNIKALRKSLTLRKESESKLAELESLLYEQKQLRDKEAAEIQAIKNSRDFKKYFDLENRKADIEAQIKALDAEMHHNFSSIDAAMRKFERITTNEAKVAVINQDAVSAVINDADGQVPIVLDQLRQSVETNAIELKPDKKLRTLEALGKFSPEMLKEFRRSRKSLLEEEAKIEQEKDRHDQTEKIARHLEEQKKAEHKIASLQARIAEVVAERDKIDTASQRKKIEDMINQLDDSNVVILLP